MESGHQEGRQRDQHLWSIFSKLGMLSACEMSPLPGRVASSFRRRAKAVSDLVVVTKAAGGTARLQIQVCPTPKSNSICHPGPSTHPPVTNPLPSAPTQEHRRLHGNSQRPPPSKRQCGVEVKSMQPEFKPQLCTYRLCDFRQTSNPLCGLIASYAK